MAIIENYLHPNVVQKSRIRHPRPGKRIESADMHILPAIGITIRCFNA